MDKAIQFAEDYISISEIEKKTIKNARKTLLFTDPNEPWVKKSSPFDVSMGAYDGAEVCEIVGLLILDKIKQEIPNIDFGLYRDDGLGAYKTTRGRTIDNTRKRIIEIFKNFGLSITIETRLHKVDFLDVTLNLQEGTYKPYRKPNDKPTYIHVQSNHPPHVIKQIPKMVGKRLSKISKTKEIFDEGKHEYNQALGKSGYKEKINYDRDSGNGNRQNNKKRKRKVIWYNPPYNNSVTTNFGQQFLSLVDKHFGKKRKDKLHKIFNRKTIKISYSCTPNMNKIISNHNAKILMEKEENSETNKCNCKTDDKPNCPLRGNCVQETVIYKATVSTDTDVKTYIGSTEGSFKKRFYNHRTDFKKESNRSNTALASYVWDCKDRNITTSIKWEILKKCMKYSGGTRKCDVCLTEKAFILKNKNNSLNKRTELMGKCRHLGKYKLKSIKKV